MVPEWPPIQDNSLLGRADDAILACGYSRVKSHNLTLDSRGSAAIL